MHGLRLLSLPSTLRPFSEPRGEQYPAHGCLAARSEDKPMRTMELRSIKFVDRPQVGYMGFAAAEGRDNRSPCVPGRPLGPQRMFSMQ